MMTAGLVRLLFNAGEWQTCHDEMRSVPADEVLSLPAEPLQAPDARFVAQCINTFFSRQEKS
jgi:hypothetical protein